MSLSSYKAQGGEAPTQIYLCGGGAFVSGAESFLQGELEIPTKHLPIPTLELGERATARASELPLFAKALGLALSCTGGRAAGFDLRKGPLAYERGFGWVRERMPVLVGLGAVIAASFVFSSVTAIASASKDRAALEGALSTVTKEVLNEPTTSAARAQELLAQQGAADEDPMPHADAFDVMVRMSEHIPQSMTHDIEELDVQKNHVVVHGIVPTVADTETIRTNMKNERCFFDPKITRTSQMVGENRQKYVLEFDLKCPEDQKTTEKKAATGAAVSASAAATGGK
jgi:general secretion pathway protein L